MLLYGFSAFPPQRFFVKPAHFTYVQIIAAFLAGIVEAGFVSRLKSGATPIAHGTYCTR
jgi:hypothetical protein